MNRDDLRGAAEAAATWINEHRKISGAIALVLLAFIAGVWVAK